MFLVVFIVGAVAGVSVADRCKCMSPQWEGVQSLISGSVAEGQGYVSTGMTNLSYDATNKKVFSSSDISSSGKSYRSVTIQDYNKGIQYSIVDNVCHKTNLSASTWSSNCLPADAQFLSSSTMGMGSSLMNVTSYMVGRENMKVYVTLTDNCVPLVEVVQGTTASNIPYLSTTGFIGLTEGIRNPAVFTPPAICNNVTLQMVPPRKRAGFVSHA